MGSRTRGLMSTSSCLCSSATSALPTTKPLTQCTPRRLSGIAKSIAGAKSDFEATVRRLWDSYVVAYQRLKDLSKSAEGRIRKLQEGATRESRDLQTRLDKSIAAGQESFAEAERLGSSAQLAQLLSVPSD
mmetsp:Transcript_40743/g.96875  ORF Transcript_40743/g.96875 Transcript_40743/m.96875 type:complete len:131 (-) Transcript_40743:239-631(-)